MKISKQDFEDLSVEVNKVVSIIGKQHLLTMYEAGQFVNSDWVKDLNRRFRWDLFWKTPFWAEERWTAYKDAHMDTALRKIMKNLEIELVKRY